MCVCVCLCECVRVRVFVCVFVCVNVYVLHGSRKFYVTSCVSLAFVPLRGSL